MAVNNKIHTQYIGREGAQVPGVTTIIGVLSKPALIHWAWKLGTQGIDYRKHKDDLAEVGTVAHLLIMKHLLKEKPDLSVYSQSVIDRAENSFLSYLEWERHHTIKPMIVEKPLVSDKYNFGGTPDLIGYIDDIYELIDFKTGNAIYSDYFTQLAAYRQLASEQGETPNTARILRIGRSENEGFEERTIKRFDLEFELFLHCLAIYNLQKELKR